MLDMSERLDGDFISAIANECKDLGIYAAVGVDLRGKVGRRIRSADPRCLVIGAGRL